MKNKISFSSSPLTRITGNKYYDLGETINLMVKLWRFSIIHGFEFQHLAEWNKRHPPKDPDPRYNRVNNWKDSTKYTISEISSKLNSSNLPVLSIHGNRDIGMLLCSENKKYVKDGINLIKDSAKISNLVNAEICVFHIWNTNAENLNLSFLRTIVSKISRLFPRALLSVENVPTKLPNSTPFELIKDFKYITMDLRWCAVYDELIKFSKIKNKIINVHVRGQLEGDEWKMKNSPFTLEESLDIILKQWNYKGTLTFEPEGGLTGAKWENIINAIGKIRDRYSL